MGWRGTVRSLSAAMRAAERDSQRRHKQFLKEQHAADAADAVSDWRDYIHDLVSIHTSIADDIDWHSVARRLKPPKPVPTNSLELQAREKLECFSPSKMDFLKGGSDKRRQRLVDVIAQAIIDDSSRSSRASSDYEEAFADWKADKELAERLIAGEAAAKRDVIAEMQSLASEDLIGKSIAFRCSDDFVHAIPSVHADDVVPNFRRKQLQSGRLSETKMPVGQFYELYQDYVSSVALRVAGDIFGMLPVEEAYVTCISTMLNTANGHQEPTPILSIHFVRETFRQLNLRQIDPSDSLSNFNHEMKFRKTKGFERIEPLKSLDDGD